LIFISYKSRIAGIIIYFLGVSKLFIFTELGIVENLVQETEFLLSEAANHQVTHILRSSLTGCEKWHRYAGKKN
jgi:hypothetical protein